MAALRRLVHKALGGQALTDDFELHTAAVGQCHSRNRFSEALQKQLDQRHRLALLQASACKTSTALAAWWCSASEGRDLPGVLWATLTHPRCEPALVRTVLGQVHLLQHQVGMATRVELQRFEALIDENAVLARQLGLAQARSARQAASAARQLEALEAELLCLRGQTMARDMALARQRQVLLSPQTAVPHGPGFEGTAAAPSAADQAAPPSGQALGSALAPGLEPDQTLVLAPVRPPARAPLPELGGAVRPLADRAVLCVGGRPASVPLYRLVVERTGGRFMHHDGGDEQPASKLDATLAAADLVICQTGCVSHGAYWRVKDHCKRTGKRCVFVETPGRVALERALAQVATQS